MSEPLKLADGYYWSPKLTTPNKLIINQISSWVKLEPGFYDFVTIPVGDNWQIADVDKCVFTTVEIKIPSGASIMPRFTKYEPSCGFVIACRGPYTSGAPLDSRGSWKINSPPGGMAFGRLSMPVYAHSGGRSGRYLWNGHPWCGMGNYPELSNTSFWGNKNPVGPKLMWSNERAKILPSENGPDVTIVAQLPKGKMYVSISRVDMFGRETALSEPVEVTTDYDASFVFLRNEESFQIGCSGYYVYVGDSPTDMHRQPILNYDGSANQYIWPAFLKQFVIHKLDKTNIRPVAPPSYGVASIINWPQKQVADGKKVIYYDKESYDLYCPFILPWNPNSFGRTIGGNANRVTFNHKTAYGNAPLVKDIPLLLIENIADEVHNATFKSSAAIAGATFSGWSGGQSFFDSLEECYFELASEDSYGFLIDDLSTRWYGDHTVSECRIKTCKFYATIPIKIEGNQSSKNRFTDMCSFIANGMTRYLGDTSIVYGCTPNDIDLDNVEGMNGYFRSIVTLSAWSGQCNVTIKDFFCDQGANVYVTINGHVGGKVIFSDGERVNPNFQAWLRLVEAPTALLSSFESRNVRIVDQGTVISYQLNQLSTYTDFNISEFIAPDEFTWLQKGLQFEYPSPGETTSSAYYNFSEKRVSDYHYGFKDIPNSIVAKVPTAVNNVPISTKAEPKLKYSSIQSY